MKYKIVEDHLELEEFPNKFKKLTATRFATILGLNAWNTPFSAWCEITKIYEKPFEESIYTNAGKVIEPKVINYLKKVYFMDIKDPTEVYGPDYFKKTWGDFFPEQAVFGGMWDSLGDTFVVEIKTTKRAEDWQKDVPIYYKLQACLYAYLLGFDDIIITVSFLEKKDYENPEKFEPSIKNTKIYEFKLSKEIPNFEEKYIAPALEWWREHIVKGVSPAYDGVKDKEILLALRRNTTKVGDQEVSDVLSRDLKVYS